MGSKKVIIIAVVLVVLVVFGIFLYMNYSTQNETAGQDETASKDETASQDETTDSSEEVSYGSGAEALGAMKETGNAFQDVVLNPFEEGEE